MAVRTRHTVLTGSGPFQGKRIMHPSAADVGCEQCVRSGMARNSILGTHERSWALSSL